MNKREVLIGALAGATATLARSVSAQAGPKVVEGPTILTVSGSIGSGNRGPLDPALDLLMAKQKVSFSVAHEFDFAALAALARVDIRPTLEYDGKPHTLSGPLFVDVMKAAGARLGASTSFLVRAIDGYAVVLPYAETTDRRFILATHIDGRPMRLGGLGPLWAVYDADKFPDMAAKPVNQRFSLCPWATYHIEVKAT
ncbi:MAG: molybdopterin-dependent oxidoreductase [Burkholderiaceae bacterium]